MASSLSSLKSAMDNAAYFQNIREQMAMLSQGKILALQKDQNAVNVGYRLPTRAAELEKNNLDKEISKALDSLKSPGQAKLENFLFGQQVGQRETPKIATAEENVKAFTNYDWTAIASIYDNEYNKLAEILALEKPFLNFQKSGQSPESEEPPAAGPVVAPIEAPPAPAEPAPIPPETPPAPVEPTPVAPQASTIVDARQAEYYGLYKKYYDDFIVRGFSEQDAKDLAKQFADVAVASNLRSSYDKTDFETDPSSIVDSVVISSTVVSPKKSSKNSSNALVVAGEPTTREGKEFFNRAKKYEGTQKSLTSQTIGAFVTQLTRPGGSSSQIQDASINEPDYDIDSVVVRKESPLPSEPSKHQGNSAAKSTLGTAVGAISGLASKGVALAAKALGPVAMLAHKALALIPKEWKKKLKDMLLGGMTGVYILVNKIIASIFGGAATFLSNILGGGSAVTASAGALPAGATLSGTGVSGFLSGLSSGGVVGGGGGASGILAASTPTLIVTGTVGGVATVYAAVMVTTAAAFIGTESSESYAAPKFTVTKQIVSVNGAPVVDNSILNIGENSAEVVYKVTFTSEGEPITLALPTDKPVSYKSNRDPIPLDVPSNINFPSELAANESKSVTFAVVLPGGPAKNFDDSRLVNTISVVGTITKEEKPTSQTQTASVSLRIGNPIDGPPFGFPIAGRVNTLDYDTFSPGKGGCRALSGFPPYTHCGEFLPGQLVAGGIDIGGTGQVQSTVDGTVEVSTWDGRPGGVGGKVVISTDSHQYLVSFLHLANAGRPTAGTRIFRGDPIGTPYLEYYGGTHIHYQIKKDGKNLPFATAPAGDCSTTGLNIMTLEQKAVIDERVKNKKTPTISAGPFDCN